MAFRLTSIVLFIAFIAQKVACAGFGHLKNLVDSQGDVSCPSYSCKTQSSCALWDNNVFGKNVTLQVCSNSSQLCVVSQASIVLVDSGNVTCSDKEAVKPIPSRYF
jgi:hypothetical protein